jgi:hypothetical protein
LLRKEPNKPIVKRVQFQSREDAVR